MLALLSNQKSRQSLFCYFFCIVCELAEGKERELTVFTFELFISLQIDLHSLHYYPNNIIIWVNQVIPKLEFKAPLTRRVDFCLKIYPLSKDVYRFLLSRIDEIFLEWKSKSVVVCLGWMVLNSRLSLLLGVGFTYFLSLRLR